MRKYTLGGYSLTFSNGGKLSGLAYKNDSFLCEPKYNFNLKDGRVFKVGGWDECFPSIEANKKTPLMGDLIASRPGFKKERCKVSLNWRKRKYSAKKTFKLEYGKGLLIDFEVKSVSKTGMEFLWASHALFKAEGLKKVSLPDGSLLKDFRPDDTCKKFFVRETGRGIKLSRKGLKISLKTDQPYWGIWLNRGGWPKENPAGFSCIGIEATNSCSEVPSGAVLKKSEKFNGRIWLEVSEVK